MDAKPCKFCKEMFVPTQSARVFCSEPCWYKWRKREATVQDSCKNCGKQITYIRSKPRTFCSNSCSAQWRYRDKKNEHVCDYCGETFYRAESHVSGNNSFCNTKCQGGWMSENLAGPNSPHWKQVEKVCEYCGEPYHTFAHTKDTSRFCSRLCQNRAISRRGEEHHNWKGGYATYYGPNWYAQQRKARKRDNHTCQHCGKMRKKNGRALDVHHITPFRKFGIERYKEANHLDNLISLCMSCHTTETHRQG